MTLLPGNLPLRIRRGVSFGPILISCQDGEGNPFNLTGYTVSALARPEIGSPNTIDLDPDITDAINGGITLEFTDEETERLLRPFPPGEYVYDVVLQNSSGEKLEPSISGVLTVEDFSSRRNP